MFLPKVVLQASDHESEKIYIDLNQVSLEDDGFIINHNGGLFKTDIIQADTLGAFVPFDRFENIKAPKEENKKEFWECPKCKKQNKSKRFFCKNCQSLKPMPNYFDNFNK